jgi:hypothetical protein
MHMKWWGMIGLALALGSGAGLWLLLSRTMPTSGLLAVVVLLLSAAVTGLALPITGYLNNRFARRGWQREDNWRVPRQAAWGGIFVGMCAWLQSLELLNWTMAAILALTFVLVEAYFLGRGN